MNIELKPRPAAFTVPVSANDNIERASLDQGHVSSARRRAVIYQPAKSATTSGRAGTKRWLLEFAPQSPPFIEPLMGWIGSTDPMAHMRLSFSTHEAGVAYAERHGLDYEVQAIAKPVKTAPSVDPRWTQPMALWPIELLSDPNIILMSEMDGFMPNLAA